MHSDAFNACFLDDGVLAGTKSAVLRAMHLIEELGPPFGIFINLAKCELFSRNELSSTFPVVLRYPVLRYSGPPLVTSCSAQSSLRLGTRSPQSCFLNWKRSPVLILR